MSKAEEAARSTLNSDDRVHTVSYMRYEMELPLYEITKFVLYVYDVNKPDGVSDLDWGSALMSEVERQLKP